VPKCSSDDAQKPTPEMLFSFLEKQTIMLELCSISAYYASIILDAFMLQIWRTPPCIDAQLYIFPKEKVLLNIIVPAIVSPFLFKKLVISVVVR